MVMIMDDVLLVMIMDVEMNDCLACCTKCDLLTHMHWCAVFFSTNWVSGPIIRISKVCSKECQKQTCVADPRPELELSPACVTTLSLHYAMCCVSCMYQSVYTIACTLFLYKKWRRQTAAGLKVKST